MPLNENFLQELKMRMDIESVISPYVKLRRNGRTFKGLCPFHNEKTPSFTVYPDTQSYYCFGCGAGGDIITFTRSINNLDYMEAVKLLAQQAGLDLPEDGYDDALGRKRRRMYEANREAARFFHRTLYTPQGANALAYIQRRGLTRDTITRFGLGCAPDSWDSLLTHMRKKGFSPQELYEADLVKKSERGGRTHYYDNFRNRFITPIIDLRGNVIGFGGRVLDDSKPKYVNTSDTLVYSKRQAVFALNFAKDSCVDSLILCEGYMDVIALHQAGFTNSVACLGTALTEEQVKLISRYTSEVALCYDNDEAGQKAAQRAIAMFGKSPVKVRVIKLSGGKDPDEIIKNHGKERFRALYQGASNEIEYKLLRERDRFDVRTADGRRDFLEAAARILASADPIERDIYAGRLADETGTSKDAIVEKVKLLARTVKRRERAEMNRAAERRLIESGSGKVNPEREKNLRAVQAEELLIATVAANPEVYQTVRTEIQPEDFVTSFCSRVFGTVYGILETGGAPDLSAFSPGYSDAEISEIARIINLAQRGADPHKVCADCIKTIRSEKAKMKTVDPSTLSDEEWYRLFQGQ